MIRSAVFNANPIGLCFGLGIYTTSRTISTSLAQRNMDTATFRKAAHAAIDESKVNIASCILDRGIKAYCVLQLRTTMILFRRGELFRR